MKIFLNGSLVAKEKAVVSVFDHGLLYGDGVFEGIRSYHGRVFELDAHIERLYRSAHAIALKIPMTQKKMAEAVVATCRANKTFDGYIRLVVTRGVGTLGLNPYLCKKAQIVIIADSIQLYKPEVYQNGLRVVTVGTHRNLPEAINPNIKSLNYLNNVLAKIEALNASADEGLMLNPQGYVAEATGDNVFVVNGRTLRTPPAWAGALEGITRRVVMELAEKAGYEVCESMLTRYDLYTADEVFFTGTAAEIIGVVELDKRKIGRGKPGRVTNEMRELFVAFAKESGVPI